jgi:hypothetical protein
MRVLIVLGMTLLLSGCLLTTREPAAYTQSEIDAINYRMQCKALARTLVQVSRCEVGR